MPQKVHRCKYCATDLIRVGIAESNSFEAELFMCRGCFEWWCLLPNGEWMDREQWDDWRATDHEHHKRRK